MTNTAKLLQELIALPSVNPAFLPPGDPLAGEARVSDFLAKTASAAGLDVEVQPVLHNRANVLARYTPQGKVTQRILMAPHMDTVGGNPLPGDLFTPRLLGHRLFGRGACDTKGSLTAMLAALIDITNAANPPRHTEITLAALIDEEAAQAGSRALVRARWRADLAIVGEPTRLKIVTAHKGVLWLSLTTRGKAAHGARPELGRNAVHEMARVVDLLETKYAAQLRRRKHPLLGHATVNIGAIHGGSQPNIVPAECMALLDRRMLPGETDAQVIREIKGVLKSRNLSVSIHSTHPAECCALETDPQLGLVAKFRRCIGQRQPAGVDYFSDAGVLADGGIPSVLFGPGDIAQAHTPDEWIDIRQVERARQYLVRFFESLP